MSNFYTGPLVDMWTEAYPNIPFPDPDTYPDMYKGVNIVVTNNIVDTDGGDKSCSNGLICKYGLLDYKCQYQNSCWINLLMLSLYVIGFIIALAITLSLLIKITRVLKNASSCCLCVKGLICCFGNTLYIAVNLLFKRKKIKELRPKDIKKQKEKNLKQKLKKKLIKLKIGVNLSKLDHHKAKRIQRLFNDYIIVSQQSLKDEIITNQN